MRLSLLITNLLNLELLNCLFPLNYLIFPSKFAGLSHRTQQFCHFFCLCLCQIDTFVSKVLTKLMKINLITALTLLATVTFAQHKLVGVFTGTFAPEINLHGAGMYNITPLK